MLGVAVNVLARKASKRLPILCYATLPVQVEYVQSLHTYAGITILFTRLYAQNQVMSEYKNVFFMLQKQQQPLFWSLLFVYILLL